MKKIILTAFSAFLLFTAKAQQANTGNTIRQRLAELNTITDPTALTAKLKELQQGTVEENYLVAYSYYSSKGMTEPAENLQNEILKKFPKGRLALQQKIQEIGEISDLDARDKSFVEFYKEYPDENFGFLTYSLSQDFAARGDDAKMRFYADIYGKGATDGKGNPIAKETIYAMMAGSMVQTNPELAAGYLKYGVDAAEASLAEMKASSSPDPNLLSRAQNNYFAVLTNYVTALSNGKDVEKGYQEAQKAYLAIQEDKKADPRSLKYLEGAYVQTLIKTKRFKEALPYIENAVKEDQANKAMMEQLKTAYVAVNGSESGYKAYEGNLLVIQEENIQAEIAKMAVSKPAPDFELKDVDGNLVKLSDLKGKVVVLDFWATWCGPCKASFPAMQKAVDKYKNDPNVKFLFLHTWEKGGGDPTANAKKYVTDNKYSFEVLMDLRDPKTNASAVASAYKVDGIPTKIIIDTHGQIRFSTSGFGADADKAVKELSNMIAFAKKG